MSDLPLRKSFDQKKSTSIQRHLVANAARQDPTKGFSSANFLVCKVRCLTPPVHQTRARLTRKTIHRPHHVAEGRRRVSGTNGKSNGQPMAVSTAPPVIAELAASCVRYVQHGVGFTLDFEPETLPVLDHYVELARKAASERKETTPLVAQAVGAYFGEVTRRKYGGFWRIEDDPRSFRVELEPVYLVLRPIEIISRALELPPEPKAPDVSTKRRDGDEYDDDDEGESEAILNDANENDVEPEPDPEDDVRAALFELDEDDRAAVAERLAALAPVSASQYHSPSTHFEVVELIVETIRARRIASGMEPDAHLEPDDYAS
jgi:hypothetical protein